MPIQAPIILMPATRPLYAGNASDLTLSSQLFRYYAAPKADEEYLRDKVELVCSTCGKSYPTSTGYYCRKKTTRTHHEGDPMQPCKECRKSLAVQYRKDKKCKI